MKKEFAGEITNSSLDLQPGWGTRIRRQGGNPAKEQSVKDALLEAITTGHLPPSHTAGGAVFSIHPHFWHRAPPNALGIS